MIRLLYLATIYPCDQQNLGLFLSRQTLSKKKYPQLEKNLLSR